MVADTPDPLSNLADVGFQNELAQVRAKAVLTELVSELPNVKWTYSSSRFARNVAAALFQIQRRVRDGTFSEEYLAKARPIGQAWEALSKLQESAERRIALLNAAAAYELAGYQANAACLARQVVPKGSLLNAPTFLQLAAVFLQRLFLQVITIGELASRVPPDELQPEELLEEAASALAAAALADASRYFLTGNPNYLVEAGETLQAAERGFASFGRFLDANLALTLRSLFPVMKTRTTWEIVGSLLPNEPRWHRYLLLLARGPGKNILRTPSVSELWPSQIHAVRSGLLTAESRIIRMPTSAGKTRIAELALVHSLLSFRGSRCVYVAPYRALVTELEQQFLSLLADLGFKVSTLTGSFESDPFEEYLTNDADLLVLTPEKLDLLKRMRPEFVANVRLVIIDEGHMIQDSRRGVKLELLISRLKRSIPEARFIFISAVVAQQTLEEFATWLNAGGSGILQSEWRAPIQRYAAFQWTGKSGTLVYSPLEDVQQLRRAFVPGIVREQTFEFVNPNTGRINRRKFPDGNKAQLAAELGFRYSEIGPVLIFCSQRNHAESVGQALLARLEYMRASHQEQPVRFSTSNTRAAQLANEWLGEDHVISECLKNGIAIHHGSLPDMVRTAVESDFHDGRYTVIVATNTLAQGVNLPLRTVIFHSCWRGSQDSKPIRIPARDYWNIAGRAGRARFETEGTVIHIVLTDNDLNDVNYFLSQRTNLEPLDSGLTQVLKGLIANRLSEAAVAESLDPEILAILVEEGISVDSTATAAEMLDDTLASVQAERSGISIAPLKATFTNLSNAILSSTPANMLASYSSTGLRSSSCETVRAFIEERREVVKALITTASDEQTALLVNTVLEACRTVPEMQPEVDFSGSYEELLTRWISGSPISSLREEFEFAISNAQDLPNFIEDFFGYRLPWGISSILKIAVSVLQLETGDLSEFVRYFPAVVRYGVPTIQAAWAMSAGVPFRQTAIRISAVYKQRSPQGTKQEFLEWLTGLETEDWNADFGLKSPALEDVMRALSLRVRNPLLSPEGGMEILPVTLGISGTTREGRHRLAIQVQEGEALSLKRDYESPDRNAVQVIYRQNVIGYLPFYYAQALAPELDSGITLKTKAVVLGTGSDRQLAINIAS